MSRDLDLSGRHLRSGAVYAVGRSLGEGRFGSIYHATREVQLTGQCVTRDVALRVLPAGLALSPRVVDAAAQLAARSPVPVAVVEAFELSGRAVVVYEHVRGRDLATLLSVHRAAGRPLAEGLVLRVGAELSRALALAHAGGPGRAAIVHGDLAPGRVLLEADGAVRLTELALGSPVDAPGEGPALRHPRPGYAAPELARGRDVGDRRAADVYALGVVLWELCGGMPVPTTATPHEHRDALDRWRAAQPGQAALTTILSRMLLSDPDERPSAEQCAVVFAELEQAAVDTGDTVATAAARRAAQALALAPPLVAPSRPPPDRGAPSLPPLPVRPPASAPASIWPLRLVQGAVVLALMSLGFLVGRTLGTAEDGPPRPIAASPVPASAAASADPPESATSHSEPAEPPAPPALTLSLPIEEPVEVLASGAVAPAASSQAAARPTSARAALPAARPAAGQLQIDGPVRKATALNRATGAKIDLPVGATVVPTGEWRVLLKSTDAAGQVVSTTLDLTVRAGRALRIQCDAQSGACAAEAGGT